MRNQAFFLALLLFVQNVPVQCQRECSKPIPPTHGFLSRCTNGVRHMSVCATICEPGYEMKGSSRMLCYCGTRSCLWRGSVPTCEEPGCAEPDFDAGRVRVVDNWPGGFVGVMEMSNVPNLDTKLTSGWSIVLALDRPLGHDAKLTSWNVEVVSSSYDQQIFTLANTKHNSNLSRYLEQPSFRWAFAVNNLDGEPPKEAYIGLYNKRIDDASCYKPPEMVRITSISSGSDEPQDSTTTTSTTIGITPDADTTMISATTAPSSPLTDAYSTEQNTSIESTSSVTTTEVPTTAKTPKKKPRRRRPRKGKNAKNKAKTTTQVPELTSIASSAQATTFEETIISTENVATTTQAVAALDKMGGRYCILQTHAEHYKTQEGWEDLGVPYFSGNAILNVTEHLLDWSMLMVFDEPIDEIQVWSVTIVETSEDKTMWTFGPHDWNLDLYAGLTDINFIAKQVSKTSFTPVAQVYLCSLAFTEGDKIITSPDSPAQRALASGTLGQVGSNEADGSPASEESTDSTTDEEELIDIGDVPRWKKPKKIAKRCQPNSPTGRVPPRQRQTQPDFKPNDDGTKFNYNEILHKSILFYEAQRAGKLPKSNRILWRGDSTLKDGCEIGVDLSGGWFDAGDHVKFSLPMANSVALLAWSGLLFKDAYEDAGEFVNLQNSVWWPAQYLVKSHISRYEYVAQVGSGNIDHGTFGRPEEMVMKRPVHILTPEKPGTEPTAEAAAALSAVHLLLKTSKKRFAKLALKHAEELFEFADRFRGVYHDSIPDVKDFYFSFSGYKDELVWAAAWLYKATGKQKYLDKAKVVAKELGGQYAAESEMSWDRKLIAAQILLANLTGDSMFRTPISSFMRNVINAKKTPKGLMWLRRWGPNRYAANAAFMVLAASTLYPPLPDIDKYVDWATKQIHLVLGDIGRSYVVGFGKNYPDKVHHRSSNCKPYPAVCNRKLFFTPQPNYFVLYGALVGGPDEKEVYSDNRVVYEQTEVACDYNAGFQGAVAGLKNIALRKRARAISYIDYDLGRWSGS